MDSTRTSNEVLINRSSEVEDVNAFRVALPNEGLPEVTLGVITVARYLADIDPVPLGNAEKQARRNYTPSRGFNFA